MDDNAPADPDPAPRQKPLPAPVENAAEAVEEAPPDVTGGTAVEALPRAAGLLDAILAIQKRKKRDGSGRAAATVARRFAVSQTTVYQARKILKNGSSELIDAVRRGELPIKTAYKKLTVTSNHAILTVEESQIENL
jgi:hypothetical protein